MSDRSQNAETEKAAPGTPVRVRRVVASSGGVDQGVVTLDAADFARLEECMAGQTRPNEAMRQAAALHRQLTSRR